MSVATPSRRGIPDNWGKRRATRHRTHVTTPLTEPGDARTNAADALKAGARAGTRRPP